MRSATTMAILIALGVRLVAQSTDARTKPSDYPVQAALGKFTIAAEYLVHSIPTSGGILDADDYLVVEVAFFGPKPASLQLSTEKFALRINGKKDVVLAEPPGMIVGSLTHPDWHQGPGGSASAGVGDRAINLGPPVTPRFPGDPTVRSAPPSPVPPTQNPSGIEKEPSMTVEERVQRASLPEGAQPVPVAGLIYFPFHGKTKSLRLMELIFEDSNGKATLKLLP